MAHRSQSSSIGDNPLDPNYLPPHYREEYRLAIDALIEKDIQGYYEFLKGAEMGGFLAQPEIEYIRSTLQFPSQTSGAPELTYHESAGDEGSSDTYWPMQSDLAAPGLDLGWPVPQHSFFGPTEVTTLVNPSDPDMPSIKEQARRLIKNAHQVIAVVMDMFTDVDIFADLLEAAGRHVPVYILLDQQEAHHFVSMVVGCKVNLDLIPMMRVRTVPGTTYYSRTGKSFKGQVKERFILADCRAVLSGSYSFMWSYEKIHRCIAHLFLGQLVSTFDEEFRILFAQSEPLVIDPSTVGLALSEQGGFLSTQMGLKRTQSLRNPSGFRRQPELPSGFPYGDSDRNPVGQFLRNDTFRQTLEPGAGITFGKYSQQQFRMQQTFLEQGRSIVSRQMELNSSSWKRHSYAEGTQENYSSSRQYMRHRVMNNLDETDLQREQVQSSQYYTEGPGPGSGYGQHNRLQGFASNPPIDQRSNSSYRSDLEPPPGKYGEYLSSEDLRGPDDPHAPPVAGRYEGGTHQKRPTIGQAYACQSSPTQPHPSSKKPFQRQSDQEQDQDPTMKHGLRNWRISSYLSTCEDGGEEGLNQPLGPDAFDEPPASQQPGAPENVAPRFGTKDPFPSKPQHDIPSMRFSKSKLLEGSNKDPTLVTTKELLPSSAVKPPAPDKMDLRESMMVDGREDEEARDTPELFLSRHDSFRSRINPLLQRSSRLRSSLIFASSKREMHNSGLGLQPATEQDEELDTVRTSSIVAQILEKRGSTREPYNWLKKAEERNKEREKMREEKAKEEKPEELNKESNLVRTASLATGINDKKSTEPHESNNWLREAEERRKEKENMKQEKLKEQEQKEMQIKDEARSKGSTPKEETTTKSTEKLNTTSELNNPSARLQYFKDLETKRKASKMETEPSPRVFEPAEKKPDLSAKPLVDPVATAPPPTPCITVSSAEPVPKKTDISAKLAELSRRPSFGSSKPPIITAKPFVSSVKSSETLKTHKEEGVSGSEKKDTFKFFRPLPSPKPFKRESLEVKGVNPRRISCDEEILARDATDAEKSEMKKARSYSSSTLSHEDSREGLRKVMGSNTSINTIGEGKSEGKTLDFLKKQTQKLKGLLGPKDKDKKASGEHRSMNTVLEVNDDLTNKPNASSKNPSSTDADSKTGTSVSSRYQSPGSSVLFSSNLRDDTKVILGQISANSQKNRQEREEAVAEREGGAVEKGLETLNPVKKNRFLRPQSNNQEREGLLKRIESFRKEKKVYSRFEMGNSLA